MKKLASLFRGALLLLMALPVCLTSCINECMYGCGVDYNIQYKMDLRTNLSTEIDQMLTNAGEQGLASTLRSTLGNVFTDYAIDNDLSFFIDGYMARREQNEMNGNTATYTLFLDRNDYDHLALANILSETQVSPTGTEKLSTFTLKQAEGDTIDSHDYGLFTAGKSIGVDEFDKDIDVNLYMANCAAVVVINRNAVTTDYLQGYVSGMATDFAVHDSVFTKQRNTVVRARSVSVDTETKAATATTLAEDGVGETTTGKYAALYAVTFPSAQDAWTFDVVCRSQKDGTLTKTTLTVQEPLNAGHVKIIKTKLKEDGSLTTDMHNVGVSVKIDWKDGGSHDVDI